MSQYHGVDERELLQECQWYRVTLPVELMTDTIGNTNITSDTYNGWSQIRERGVLM